MGEPAARIEGNPVSYVILTGADPGIAALAPEGVASISLVGGPTRLLAPHPRGGAYEGYGASRDGRTLYLARVYDNGDIWMATPP